MLEVLCGLLVGEVVDFVYVGIEFYCLLIGYDLVVVDIGDDEVFDCYVFVLILFVVVMDGGLFVDCVGFVV